MSTDFPPNGGGPSGESDREAHGTSGSNFVGGDQNRWQTPDTDASTGAPSYPAPGSAAGPQYPSHDDYQMPSVGQPGYVGGSVPGNTPYPGAPRYPGAPGGPGYPSYGGYTSAPAPELSIILLWPLSIGEIPGGAFESLHANPEVMFVPSPVVMGTVGLLSAGSSTLFLSRLGLPSLTSGRVELSDADLNKIGVSLVGPLVQLNVASILSMMATSTVIGLLVVIVSHAILGCKVSLGDVWQCTRPRAWMLVGRILLTELILAVITTVVVAVAVGTGQTLLENVIASGAARDSAGTIILAILAILVMIIVLGLTISALTYRPCLAPAALVLGNIDVMEGISRPWTLTRGYFWCIVGIHLLSFIVVFFTSQTVSQDIPIVMQGLLYAIPDMTLTILMALMLPSSFVQVTVLPFDSAVVAFMYTDLRMRSEGLDVELRHAAEVWASRDTSQDDQRAGPSDP